MRTFVDGKGWKFYIGVINTDIGLLPYKVVMLTERAVVELGTGYRDRVSAHVAIDKYIAISDNKEIVDEDELGDK